MNLFKKKNKTKDNIKKSKKLLSLSSTYESSNEEEYDEIIDNCLKEKRVNNDKKLHKEFKERKNRNIAITGEYGCGKTSIINTFFARHNEYRHINVSMGVYSSKNDNIENNIYTYILKQILYYVRPYWLPYSKYSRKDYPTWYYYVVNSVFSLALIVLILIFFNIIKINSIWIKIPIMLLSMLILMMYGLSKINIKKISLDKANVEFEGKEIKLLNDNIEETGIRILPRVKIPQFAYEGHLRRDARSFCDYINANLQNCYYIKEENLNVDGIIAIQRNRTKV